MKKALLTTTLGLWGWTALAAYLLLFTEPVHPVFVTSALTNATVFLGARVILRALNNFQVEAVFTGKSNLNEKE